MYTSVGTQENRSSLENAQTCSATDYIMAYYPVSVLLGSQPRPWHHRVSCPLDRRLQAPMVYVVIFVWFNSIVLHSAQFPAEGCFHDEVILPQETRFG